MNKRVKRQILTAIYGLSFLLSGCGKNGTDTLSNQYVLGNGFGVQQSDPGYRETYVPVETNTISVSFNEAVDPNTLVPANFKFTQTSGSTVTDLTSKISIPPALPNNSTVVPFSYTGGVLIRNATYKLTLMNGVKSVSSRPLERITDVIFYTGDGTGLGGSGQSIPGQAPVVTTKSAITAPPNCIEFMFTFSEPVISQSLVVSFGSKLGGWASGGGNVNQLLEMLNDMTYRVVNCNLNLGIGMHHKLFIQQGMDNDSEIMSPADIGCAVGISWDGSPICN